MKNVWIWVAIAAVVAAIGFYAFSRSKPAVAPSYQNSQQAPSIYSQPMMPQAGMPAVGELPAPPTAKEEARTVTVQLSEQNGSGETGTAMLSAAGDQTKVVLEIAGQPRDVRQPAHIHAGSCAAIGAVRYTLNFPLNGRSETMVGASLDSLMGQLPLAINVHKSSSEISTYVACGDIAR